MHNIRHCIWKRHVGADNGLGLRRPWVCYPTPMDATIPHHRKCHQPQYDLAVHGGSEEVLGLAFAAKSPSRAFRVEKSIVKLLMTAPGSLPN